jgi:hypothetical protein
MATQNTYITLNEHLLIGEGRNRKCYLHPEDLNLCIKISFKRGQRSAAREINYLKRLHKRGKSFAMIADYGGKIQTSEGTGALFQLIRDGDGSISKNLEYYLALHNNDITVRMIALIENLRKYLIEEYILISDLDLDNILVQKDTFGNFKLIVIDGIGDNNQIPLLEYIKPLGMKRSSKKWDLFKTLVAKDFPDVAKAMKAFQ